MPTSEARIRANQQNSLRSTGPRTPTGKDNSRRNAITHGMTASTLIPDGDVPEIERRTTALMAEMDPKSTVGKILVGQLATLSYRMEKGASQELAASASRVRHAVTRFDQDREDRAEELLETISEHPRNHLRWLKRMPEGVDRLIEAWGELRDNLTRPDGATWDESHQATATAMLGSRPGQVGASKLEGLSKAARGEVPASDLDQAAPRDESGRSWAVARLIELAESQIRTLEEHRETIDLEAIEQDRVEAPGRVLFDFSPDGCRAIRYESEARRMYFKTLKEFRIAEAEVVELPSRPEVPQTSQPSPKPVAPPKPGPAPASAPLASFRDNPALAVVEFEPIRNEAPFEPRIRFDGQARGLDGRVLAVGRAVVVTG